MPAINLRLKITAHKLTHEQIQYVGTSSLPLVFNLRNEKGTIEYNVNRLQCKSAILLNYLFKIEFVHSKELGYTDGLSGLIPQSNKSLVEPVIADLTAEIGIKNKYFAT